MNTQRKLVFVDLETTGASPADDRITEIGLVCVDGGQVERWSSLVNPYMAIPPFIQKLTGINDQMVKDAPGFESLAADLLKRLEGALLIAHNVRFDHGFLVNSFQRVGLTLCNDVLCTVKLSRKLFPTEARHSLASLIERHALLPQARHRALADADVIWQFWQKLQREIAAGVFEAALSSLVKRASGSLPVRQGLTESVPAGGGVYLFYGEGTEPIFVGRGVNLRRRVRAHFRDDGQARDGGLAAQVQRVGWRLTAGEIGAALLEAQLVSTLQPAHNRLLRQSDLCAWQLRSNEGGIWQLWLTRASECDFGREANLYGLFRSQKKAESGLRELAQDGNLSLSEIDSDPARDSHGANARQSVGFCVGLDAQTQNPDRLLEMLAAIRVQSWPFENAVGLVEVSSDGSRTEMHVVDNWCYLGSAGSDQEAQTLLNTASRRIFNLDTYTILKRPLALGALEVRDLAGPARG